MFDGPARPSTSTRRIQTRGCRSWYGRAATLLYPSDPGKANWDGARGRLIPGFWSNATQPPAPPLAVLRAVRGEGVCGTSYADSRHTIDRFSGVPGRHPG